MVGGGFVGGSRLVRSGLVGRGGFVSRLGFIFGVDWGTFVFDISDISVVVISGIGDGLDSAIGKVDLVRSRDGFAISGFLSIEFGSRVVIGNSILESIRLGGFVISGLFAISGSWGIRSRLIRRGRVIPNGNGNDGTSNDESEHF